MLESKILSLVNFISASLLIYFLLAQGTDYYSLSYLFTPPIVFFLISIVLNLFLAFIFLINHKIDHKFLSMFITLTFLPLIWIVIFFLSYFVFSVVIYILLTLIILTMIYKLIFKINKKIGIIIFLITFVISTWSFSSSFEENYCTQKGEVADPSHRQTVIATKEDIRLLQRFDLHEDDQLMVNFRTHMYCHLNFNLANALLGK